jgi:hypothetical protein
VPFLPVYSAQLAASTAAAAGIYTYPVPTDGTVWVVRDIELLAPTNVGRLLQAITVEIQGVGPIWTLPYGQAVGGFTHSWRGRSVLPSGQTLAVVTQDANWAWLISGYRFVPVAIRT